MHRFGDSRLACLLTHPVDFPYHLILSHLAESWHCSHTLLHWAIRLEPSLSKPDKLSWTKIDLTVPGSCHRFRVLPLSLTSPSLCTAARLYRVVQEL